MKKVKKTIVKVNYFNKITVPGPVPYSNFNPSWSITREETVDGDPDEASKGILAEIQGIVDSVAYAEFDRLSGKKDVNLTEKPQRMTDGYPHVTSIISPDAPPIPNIEDHAKLGTALDGAVKDIVDGKDPGSYEEKLAFTYDWAGMLAGINKQLTENKIKVVAHSLKVRNDAHKFCGELDCIVDYMGGKYILDIKKTKKLTKDITEKYFKQIAAYASTQELVEGGIILTPYEIVVESNLLRYWELFLVDRGAYKQRFGV
jgi:hypothetical protein